MAGIIRDENELASLRLSRRVEGRAAVVLFELWRGRARLDGMTVPMEALGLPRASDRRDRRRAQHELLHARFALPSDAREWLGARLGAILVGPDEPLWLEIRRAFPELALVPWEALLLPLTPGPVLHLPSFVVPPRYLAQGTLRMAICASSPRAKTPFDVAAYVSSLAGSLRHAGIPTLELHVFTDADAYDRLAGLPDAVVHDPRGAPPGEAARDGDLRDARVRSPWLLWMLDALRSTPTDLVHFVGPGYFADDRGALSLARTPRENDDRQRSHFVGAEELAAFLNLAGALGVGLSQPVLNVWSHGLALLAHELAHLRPGPIVLHREAEREAELGEVYGFLFAPTPREAPRDPRLTLYCHPQRVARFAEAELPIAAKLSMAQQRVVRREKRPLARGEERAEPTWKRTMRLAADQALVGVANRAALGENEEAVQRGAAEAQRLLDELLGDDA